MCHGVPFISDWILILTRRGHQHQQKAKSFIRIAAIQIMFLTLRIICQLFKQNLRFEIRFKTRDFYTDVESDIFVHRSRERHIQAL